MKKIPSLFKRNYDGDWLVYDEVVPGSEWVTRGEGVATVKWDGTACMVRDGKLYKRYDRKLTKAAAKRKKRGYSGPWSMDDFKPAPPGWEACEPEPDYHTGHWPGWSPVGDGPDDKYHREAWENYDHLAVGTYELVGPKIRGNPYDMVQHALWKHGRAEVIAPRDFEGLRRFFARNVMEGIVWHHPDGRMVKIKRRDFGYPWPAKQEDGES